MFPNTCRLIPHSTSTGQKLREEVAMFYKRGYYFKIWNFSAVILSFLFCAWALMCLRTDGSKIMSLAPWSLSLWSPKRKDVDKLCPFLRYKERRRQNSRWKLYVLSARSWGFLENGAEWEEEQERREADAHHPHRLVPYCPFICHYIQVTQKILFTYV